MTEFVAAAYNIRDAAGHPEDGAERWPMIRESVRRLDPLYIGLSEAYAVGHEDNVGNVYDDLDKIGYTATSVNQDAVPGNESPRPDMHHLMVAVKRPELLEAEPILLGHRWAIRALMKNRATGGEWTAVSVHGDDRNEAARLTMFGSLADHLPADQVGALVGPLLVAGDLNTMSPDTLVARALRAAYWPAKVLPSRDPNPYDPPHGIRRFGSRVQRSTEMASGESYRLLTEDYKLVPADPDGTSTIGGRKLAFKLDHILLSSRDTGAGRRTDFHVVEHIVHAPNAAEQYGLYRPSSDHRMVSARLQLEERY